VRTVAPEMTLESDGSVPAGSGGAATARSSESPSNANATA
jgi:hypothetical protein